MSELTNGDLSYRPQSSRDLPQLSNSRLMVDKDLVKIVFPGGVLEPVARGNRSLSRQRIVLPKQFIVAEYGLEFLTVGVKVDLVVVNEEGNPLDGKTYHAVVIQARQFETNGKRYVLLESNVSLLELEGAKNIRIDGKNLPVGVNNTGIIHPGGSNGGGGTVHSGGAGGQSNAYGVSNLLTPQSQDPLPPGLEKDRATFETDARIANPIVAVLDTGLLYRQPPKNRQPVTPENEGAPSSYTDSYGWDFVNRDASPVDDHPHWHGTKISSILKKIASEQRKKDNQFGILPVKVANQYGVLTLYNAICGLAYAKSKSKTVRLVNASWSFTGMSQNLELPPPPPRPVPDNYFLRKPSQELPDFPLLYQAIKDLGDAGIVVVAAAGNRSQYPYPPYIIGENNAPKIYPACYSPVLNNVITVTTVSYEALIGPPAGRRNYIVYENSSSQYVDTGILTNADEHLEEPDKIQTGTFFVPGFSISHAVEDTFQGTSFATPYMVGRLAASLDQPASKNPETFSPKNILIDQLKKAFEEEDDLDNELRKPAGYYPAD